MTCTVRTGFCVTVRFRDGKEHQPMKWSLNWPRSAARRTALDWAGRGASGLFEVVEVWVTIGRWTPEAGWHFARVDYPVKSMRWHGPDGARLRAA